MINSAWIIFFFIPRQSSNTMVNVYGGRGHESKGVGGRESHNGALGWSSLSRDTGSDVRPQGGLWGPSDLSGLTLQLFGSKDRAWYLCLSSVASGVIQLGFWGLNE